MRESVQAFREKGFTFGKFTSALLEISYFLKSEKTNLRVAFMHSVNLSVAF